MVRNGKGSHTGGRERSSCLLLALLLLLLYVFVFLKCIDHVVQGGSGRVQVDLSCLAPGSLVVLAISPVERHAAALKALDSLDLAALEAMAAKLGKVKTEIHPLQVVGNCERSLPAGRLKL